MSGMALRLLIAGILAFHGIGQLMGVIAALELPALKNSSSDMLHNWSSHSFLTPILGDGLSRMLCGVLWAVPFLGFIAAALALMGWILPHELWRTLALISAVFSMVAMVFYWNGLMLLFPHKIGNIVVNCAVLICLLILYWPRESDLGI